MHIEQVEIGPAILVEIEGVGVAGPAGVDQADGRGDIDEAVVAFIFEEDAALGAFGVEVAGEGVFEAEVIGVAAAFDFIDGIFVDGYQFIFGVDADIGQEENTIDIAARMVSSDGVGFIRRDSGLFAR